MANSKLFKVDPFHRLGIDYRSSDDQHFIPTLRSNYLDRVDGLDNLYNNNNSWTDKEQKLEYSNLKICKDLLSNETHRTMFAKFAYVLKDLEMAWNWYFMQLDASKIAKEREALQTRSRELDCDRQLLQDKINVHEKIQLLDKDIKEMNQEISEFQQQSSKTTDKIATCHAEIVLQQRRLEERKKDYMDQEKLLLSKTEIVNNIKSSLAKDSSSVIKSVETEQLNSYKNLIENKKRKILELDNLLFTLKK